MFIVANLQSLLAQTHTNPGSYRWVPKNPKILTQKCLGLSTSPAKQMKYHSRYLWELQEPSFGSSEGEQSNIPNIQCNNLELQQVMSFDRSYTSTERFHIYYLTSYDMYSLTM